MKNITGEDIRDGIIYLLLGFITLLFIGCREEKIKTRDLIFIIDEKVILNKENFYLKSKDTIISVNPNDYMRYNMNDTIIFEIDTEGFWKGYLKLKK